MRSFVTSSLFRNFVLASLGLSFHACSSRIDAEAQNAQGEPDGKADAGATRVEAGIGSTLPSACTDPLSGNGLLFCREGYVHRVEARECPSKWPRDEAVERPPSPVDGGADDCARDTDCARDAFCTVIDYNKTPLGICRNGAGGGPSPIVRRCVQGCRVDADCEQNEACVCGADIGHCVPIADHDGCRTDADCDHAPCLANAQTSDIVPAALACQLPGDKCNSDHDCGVTQFCRFGATGRSCAMISVCGRPFLVDEQARAASALRGGTWLEAKDWEPSAPVDRRLAEQLAQHWTRIALMEHASVAAFARFTLQLLSLGAPMDLVRSASAAQADEVRHAATAFAFASAYAGTSIGPGPLDMSGVLAGESPEHVLRMTIREGCLGETFAAMEAGEAARRAAVPSVKAALEAIAADESAHAALAWRVVQWLLVERPELHAVAREEFDRAPVEGVAMEDTVLLGGAANHGILDGTELARVRTDALRDVVLPCARALLESVAARSLARPASEPLAISA